MFRVLLTRILAFLYILLRIFTYFIIILILMLAGFMDIQVYKDLLFLRNLPF